MQHILLKRLLVSSTMQWLLFGGDGTVNEVISGIAERDYIPKLGIIPGGYG